MQIVVSHNSLDFDALAAQFAVTKLNPGTRIALCSPILGNIRDFLTLHRNRLPLVPMKHLRDREKEISKIFIVDCQHLSRLDPLIQDLIQKGMPYSVFDHHDFDEKALGTNAQTDSIIERVGAATTLLVELIEQKTIKLNPFDASLLALGIYEDTGSLTHATTTFRDAACVSFLLRQGADLQIINEYMRTRLNENQQALFEELISRARVINLAGRHIVLAGGSRPKYIDGMAILTRKLMEVESADAAITAVQMRDRIYIVGRSDTPEISVRDIVRLYDGDGHHGAASAVLKPRWGQKILPAEILNNIEQFLRKNSQPELTAAQIMNVSAKMILPSVSMDEAGKIMIRHDLDGLLVAEQEKITGVISKRDVDQAQHHGLGHAPVSGFMSRPVIAVKPDTTLSEIQSILISNNIGRLPVLNENGRLLGIVSRQDILQTIFNNSSSVSNAVFSPLSSPVSNPVFSPISNAVSNTVSNAVSNTVSNAVSNAVSKTVSNTISSPVSNPILNSISNGEISLNSSTKIPAPYQQSRHVLHEPLAALDSDNLWLYREIGQVASQLNMVAYAVGGSVRDMLLGLANFDLDFVIEGSAISLADKLVEKYPDKFILCTKHERFQTATLTYIGKDRRVVDLSTARQEFYEYPAALPTVEPSLLKEDVFRRDFTINTLACSLDPKSFGTLINYFNGLEDLRSGIVRILHQFSFIEDPTRLLRAARFASRLGFHLDDNTAQLASHAIQMGIFDNLAGVRMKEELRLILESSTRLEALEILSRAGAKLRYLDEELEYGPEQRKLLRRAQQLLSRYPLKTPDTWLVYLALLLSRLSTARLENVLARLHLTAEARQSVIRGLAIDEELLRLGKNPKRSEIYHSLQAENETALAIASSLSAPGSPVRRAIRLYYEELKNIKISLTGEDLLQMGFKEGRQLGQILQNLLSAKLDQIVNSRQEELDFTVALTSNTRI